MIKELSPREFSIFLQGQIDFTLGLGEFDGYTAYCDQYSTEDLVIWVRGVKFAYEKERRFKFFIKD